MPPGPRASTATGWSAMRTIYLFPYGGGSASHYRSYANRFPLNAGSIVPVEIPGHGKRVAEPFAKSIEECAALTLSQIESGGEPYILHGHCMGALIAFEAIKLIEAKGGLAPQFMVASGRNAPRHVNEWLRSVEALDDLALFNELQDLGGVPRGLSFAMARESLCVIRGDQVMFRSYDPGPTTIRAPILVLAGRNDAMTSPDALTDWKDYTSDLVSIQWLEGRHYFLLDQPEVVARQIDNFSIKLRSQAQRGSAAPSTRHLT
jgi:surfactin synthase thioesterase subunit